MNSSFDSAAENYDTSFTFSVIGKMQRHFVYQHLNTFLKTAPPKTILEINCGTGEDALWLANQNYLVTATDQSQKMIAVAQKKEHGENLIFRIVAIEELSDQFPTNSVDCIFSNFGGLNCLPKTELATFFKNSSELLTKNGTLFLVIMPKNTLWETFYFLAKGNFRDAFRRTKSPIIADVDGEKIATYYYNPKEIVTLASPYFKLKQIHPIGFFVPPSYLESFFKNKPKWISRLHQLEVKISNCSFLAKYADHYTITFEKR